ncbi:MAG: hypothetical protein RLZZ31_1932 [Actinomycetota bacterium]|jgi:uncharacterized membrane protein YfcA
MSLNSPGEYALVIVIAALAGAINAVAGGGTLLTFPTLLSLGLPSVSANVTSTIALVGGYVGGIAGYRRELEGQKATVRSLVPYVLAGAIVGSTILLITDDKLFRSIVPFLVLFASVLLLMQPRLQARLSEIHPESGQAQVKNRPIVRKISVFFAAVYGGYFGGVLGIILLAVLALTLADSLQRINGLKSVLQFAINIIAVIVFAIFGPVYWLVVVVMFPASLIGGWIGSSQARRLHPTTLRYVIGTYGVICAVVLFVTL